jgi:hypothetical protein
MCRLKKIGTDPRGESWSLSTVAVFLNQLLNEWPVIDSGNDIATRHCPLKGGRDVSSITASLSPSWLWLCRFV